MGLLTRKNARPQDDFGPMPIEAEWNDRALRLVDTRGVILRNAEAELHAAVADLRAYSTPERERRVAEAIRALEEIKNG
jgi:hypothetical protein